MNDLSARIASLVSSGFEVSFAAGQNGNISVSVRKKVGSRVWGEGASVSPEGLALFKGDLLADRLVDLATRAMRHFELQGAIGRQSGDGHSAIGRALDAKIVTRPPERVEAK